MTPSAEPNVWPELSPETASLDERAALLKVSAEMFVAAPARDRESIETFETLALGFLPRVDHAVLLEIAGILAPCADTPAAILDYLTRYSPEARDILLSQKSDLPPAMKARLLATPAGRMQLACRPVIDGVLREQLLVLHESGIENALAANLARSPAEPCFEELVRRAQERPGLAGILLARSDLSRAQEAALYLLADADRRRRIREHLAGVVARRSAPFSLELTEHHVAEFISASRNGDARRFESLLNSAFDFPATTEWRVLAIGRHRLLALALKALGLCEKEATRILLTLHPALSSPLSALKDLIREMREVDGSVAHALIEAILDTRALQPG